MFGFTQLASFIAAQSHNPSILNKDFLMAKGIVPSEWDAIQTLSTPAVSVIQYANGIQWTVDQQKLQIIQECNSPFQDHDDDQIHSLAKSYVRTLPHVPYSNLGLNCIVSVIRKDPKQWLTKQFLKSGSWGNDLYMMPRFTMNVDGAILNLNLYDGLATYGTSDQKESVIIECNLHYGGPFDSIASIQDKISLWAGIKKIIASKLDKILENR